MWKLFIGAGVMIIIVLVIYIENDPCAKTHLGHLKRKGGMHGAKSQILWGCEDVQLECRGVIAQLRRQFLLEITKEQTIRHQCE